MDSRYRDMVYKELGRVVCEEQLSDPTRDIISAAIVTACNLVKDEVSAVTRDLEKKIGGGKCPVNTDLEDRMDICENIEERVNSNENDIIKLQEAVKELEALADGEDKQPGGICCDWFRSKLAENLITFKQYDGYERNWLFKGENIRHCPDCGRKL